MDTARFHVGHVDEAQCLVHQEPQPKNPAPPKTPTPTALPSMCPHCGNAITEERRLAAKQSGNSNVYCSRKCQEKGSRKARHARRAGLLSS